jgi:hypothetical protein
VVAVVADRGRHHCGIAQQEAVVRSIRSWILVLLAAMSVPAFAHTGSASYVRLSVVESGASLVVELDLRDLEYALGVDTNADGAITWGEVLSREAALTSYIRERLVLSRGERACDVSLGDLAIDAINGGAYVVVSGDARCEKRGALQVRSEMMFDLDAGHRTMVEWSDRKHQSLAVLTETARSWEAAADPRVLSQLGTFAHEGMLHIWSGIDHLAFLLVLLLPVFAVRADSRAIGWRKLIGIITAFTLAHSITLALAATGIVKVWPRLVEPAIAASVIFAAVTNLLPRTQSIGMATAFFFGLLHGFGFASALQGLEATRSSLAVALAGFNVGVETGQLLVVAAVLPVLLVLRTHAAYATRIVPAVSSVVALSGIVWVWQRVAA